MKNWIKQYWVWVLAFTAFILTWSAVVWHLNQWWILAGLILSNQLYRASGEYEATKRIEKFTNQIIEELKELKKITNN